MNLPIQKDLILSPAEQMASRKRLNQVFRVPRAEPRERSKFRPYRPGFFIPAFVENPYAPRCSWPRRDMLDLPPATRLIPMKIIREAVSLHYLVTAEELISPRRIARISHARQVFCYLANVVFSRSMPEVGRYIDRDHTTVLHGARKIGARRVADQQFAAELQALTDQIRSWSWA
jgi:hypothetical protein